MSGTSIPDETTFDVLTRSSQSAGGVACVPLRSVYCLQAVLDERTFRLDHHTIIVPEHGVVRHVVETDTHQILPGSVLHIMPGRAQRFLIDPDLEGWVVTVDRQVCPARLFDVAPPSPLVVLGQSIAVAKALVVSLTQPDMLPGRASQRLRLSLASVLLELIAGAADQAILSPEAVRDQELVGDFRRELELHYPSTRSVADYASLIGCSPKTLTRATKRVLGETPKEIIDARVINAACRLLAHTDFSVCWIAHKLGFTEQSNFSKFFQRKVGATPAMYRKSGHLS